MTIAENIPGQPYAPATSPLDPDLTAFFGFETRLEADAVSMFNTLYARYLAFCAEGAIPALSGDAFAAEVVKLPGVSLDEPITRATCFALNLRLVEDEDVAVEDAPPILTQKDRVLHVATNIAVALMLLCGGLACSIANKDLFATVFFTAAVVYVLCVDWRS